ncbi:MAG TPA: hypothetical protein VL331_07590 [Croceibacterium sp.]|jgi:hypothetical protein|nr:hypothetical protein [Croceibacterium sp.]
MIIWLLPLLVIVTALVTMLSGVWLLLHLTALVRMLADKTDLVPAKAFPRVPRRAVRTALGVFLGGTATTLAIVVLAATVPIH